MRRRILVAAVLGALVLAACGNSGSSKPAAQKQSGSGSPGTGSTAAALKQKVAISGVKGVTDSDIGVAVITSATNILQGNYKAFADGVQAYFNYVNSNGGIYGRKLKIVANRDDGMVNNEQQVKASLATDNAFATFIATPLFTGAPDLAAVPTMPVFIWNINPEFAGHPNFFANAGALCFTCAGQWGPYVAQANHYSKVAVLAYGVTASSKQCAQSVKDAFTRYPSAQVIYFDNSLQFSQPDLSAQVRQIKQKGGQIIFTCIDQKESLVLGKELVKQNANAIQVLPNSYDPKFIKDNAQYLEGDIVEPLFQTFEKNAPSPQGTLYKKWIAKLGKPANELSTYGWIDALEMVHGLKLAGPDFSQQKLIDALNQDTHFDADGLIEPIDWTKAHNDPAGPNGTSNQYAGKYDCHSPTKVHNGALVPILDQPDKPWICMTGLPNAPTLTKTPVYTTFVGTGN
jgi:ABC-type branched-subunit amino acid transport system substrate-binding protein